TFSIGGNSFGAPCQFPFKYHEKWYAECTKDGRPDGQMWCATEKDYDKEKKWGFCATKGMCEYYKEFTGSSDVAPGQNELPAAGSRPPQHRGAA
ncbi:hypothetical protein XENOCAPTIV_000195, partial [Xenoophorus captivus]